MDGRSLVRVLDGTEREPAAPLHFESYSGSRRTFVGTRDERWKFAEHLTGERELYDLAADPFELENLASRPEQATRLQQLRQRALARRPGWPNDLD
jgi:choline-sulfatase